MPSGPVAVFIGKMSEVLIPLLIVFAGIYPTARKKLNLANSKARVLALFCYAWGLSGIAYAVLYTPISSGFGTLPTEHLGMFNFIGTLVLSAIATQFVISTVGKRPSSRAELIGGGLALIVAMVASVSPS